MGVRIYFPGPCIKLAEKASREFPNILKYVIAKRNYANSGEVYLPGFENSNCNSKAKWAGTGRYPTKAIENCCKY